MPGTCAFARLGITHKYLCIKRVPKYATTNTHIIYFVYKTK